MGNIQNLNTRENKRYYVKARIFAVIRSKNLQLDKIERMSKGEIAFAVIKSQPPKMGEITEISRGGLSFTYVENEADLSKFNEMDILFTDEDFHLSRIPFKPVEDTVIREDHHFQPLLMRRQTVKFDALSSKQIKKLDHMIKNYTTGEVHDNRLQTSVGW